MNQAAKIVYGVAGGLMALALVTILLVSFGPFAGSASAGIASTGDVISGELPFIGGALAVGITLLALDARGRR